MKEGTGAVKSIRCDGNLRLPRQVQLDRVRQVMERELTPLEREVLTAYYFEKKTMDAIARERGVNKSSVCRAVHRAEGRLRRFLKY